MFLLHPTPNVAIDDKEFDTQLYETAPSPLVKYDVGSGIIGAIVTKKAARQPRVYDLKMQLCTT